MKSGNIIESQSIPNSLKIRIVLTLFRIAAKAKTNKILFVVMVPYLVFYKILVQWIMSIELPYTVKIGKNIKIHHGQNLVIAKNVTIGNNCILRHNTTIGDPEDKLNPVLGNNVEIGANCCVLGNIVINNNVIIGAGSVVTTSLAANAVFVGNPGKIIKFIG